MRKSNGSLVAALAVLLLAPLAGTGPATASDSYRMASNAGFGSYVTTNEQRRVILDCRRDLGLRGRATFKAIFPDNPPGGQTLLRIAPDGRLSPADAARINACADQVFGRPVTEVPQTAQRQFAPGCFKGAPILMGGSGYCIGGF